VRRSDIGCPGRAAACPSASMLGVDSTGTAQVSHRDHTAAGNIRYQTGNVRLMRAFDVDTRLTWPAHSMPRN
jgi:hypothetical protein